MTDRKGPRDPLGFGNLLEAGESLLKWLGVFIVLSIVLGLAAFGFAVAWWLK